MKKKILSAAMALVLLFAFACPAFAAEKPAEKYPYVFIHGMLGWGEYGKGFMDAPYWGMKKGNIPEYFRSNGYEVAVPTVGPVSSAWDRACEAYAQLMGTVVDYGAYHSEKCGHSRYGRDYTGKALLDNWDGVSPINIITHSFGGPTATVFASLMEYGCKEEVNAAPDDCSELFKGGKEGTVYSVNTLASPHNGVPLSNLASDLKAPIFAIAAFINLTGNTIIDFMLDQYGLTTEPSQGKTAPFNIKGIINIVRSNDNCAYDMSLGGAKELYDRFPAAKHTYYYSYSGDITEDGLLGRKLTSDFAVGPLALTGTLNALSGGMYFGGQKIGDEWAASDGLVPVVSAQYPFNQAHEFYTPGMNVQKGIWYSMPVTQGASHGYHVSGEPDVLYGFYDGLVAVVERG